jgi:hypothetical protein
MFENTIYYGSVIGVLCLSYSMNVAIEALRVSNSDHGRVFGPRIAHSGIASLFSIAALPCILWPALYVGMFDGWVAGIVAWIGLQVLGGLATIIFRIRGPLLGLHIVLGMFALPAGYFLTLSNPPW